MTKIIRVWEGAFYEEHVWESLRVYKNAAWRMHHVQLDGGSKANRGTKAHRIRRRIQKSVCFEK